MTVPPVSQIQPVQPVEALIQQHTNKTSLQTRYEVLRMEAIPTENVHPHPANPRPTFHLSDTDENLKAMGDSIKTTGQSLMALVFEQVDNPGHYTLLQGERRWRACKIAGVPTLKCNVIAAPVTFAEELEWLGNEEAFKQPWQPYFVLKHAWILAQEHGVPVDHPEMTVKTGLSMNDLRLAQKVFSLCPEIQDMCIQYEETLYKLALEGKRKRRARLTYIDGAKVPEFPVSKAGLVWDICEALNSNFPMAVKDYTTEELQILVANRATRVGSSIRDLEQFLGAIKTPDPPAGLLSQISSLLENPKKTLRDVNRVAGTQELITLNNFVKRSTLTRKNIEKIVRSKSNLGSNVDFLKDCRTEILSLINEASNFERIISEHITKVVEY